MVLVLVDILLGFRNPRFCDVEELKSLDAGDPVNVPLSNVRYFVCPKLTCLDVRDVGVVLLCSCEAAEAIVAGVPGTDARATDSGCPLIDTGESVRSLPARAKYDGGVDHRLAFLPFPLVVILLNF